MMRHGRKLHHIRVGQGPPLAFHLTEGIVQVARHDGLRTIHQCRDVSTAVRVVKTRGVVSAKGSDLTIDTRAAGLVGFGDAAQTASGICGGDISCDESRGSAGVDFHG